MDVAEEARVGRAGHHARGLALRLGQRLVVDAVDAQRALLHHLLLLVELAHAVRTGPRAVLAADALVVVDEHDAVLGALVARAGRAHRHARRVLAVQARLREVHRLRVRELADLEGLHAVEEGAGRILAVRDSGRRAARCAGVFHSLQLVTQAWQPTQTLRSMTSASCFVVMRGEMRTRTSYQPAWPVTGSELEVPPRTRRRSEMRWFEEEAALDSFASGASATRRRPCRSRSTSTRCPARPPRSSAPCSAPCPTATRPTSSRRRRCRCARAVRGLTKR